jgi:hypothetical protein
MAKSLAPAFQFYPNDWLSSTNIALMNPAQEGAYIRLLCYAWNDPDCSIPNNDEKLSALSRLGSDWNLHGTQVKECFEPHPEKKDRLINSKLYRVRSEMLEYQRTKSAAGKKGAQKRWQNKSSDKEFDLAEESQAKSLPLTPHITKNNSSSSPSSSSSSSKLNQNTLLNKNLDPQGLEKDRNSCFDFSEEHMDFAQYMLNEIREFAPSLFNGKKRPPNLDSWANDVRLMQTEDGHEVREIWGLYQWILDQPPQSNGFSWKANILSPKDLRKKWAKAEARKNCSRLPDTATVVNGMNGSNGSNSKFIL